MTSRRMGSASVLTWSTGEFLHHFSDHVLFSLRARPEQGAIGGIDAGLRHLAVGSEHGEQVDEMAVALAQAGPDDLAARLELAHGARQRHHRVRCRLGLLLGAAEA